MESKLTPVAAALGLVEPQDAATLATSSRPTKDGASRRKRTPAIIDKTSDDYLLSFEDIESEGGPRVATQYNWACTNKYGWRDLITKVGGRSRIARHRWRKWLAERERAGGREVPA